MPFPIYRPRRLRESPLLRSMVRETALRADDFVYPLFAVHGRGVREPIGSMPGQYRLSIDELLKECKDAASMGIPAVLLFGLPRDKDPRGSEAYAEDGIIQQAVRAVKDTIPDLLVITDVCLCEYTSHGHCGVVEDGRVKNDPVARADRADRDLPRRGRRGHGRALRHDGRPRGRHPRGPRRGRIHRDADHGLLGQVRLRVLRALPRGGGLHPAVRRSALLPDGPRQRRSRRCARSRSTWTRAPTS